MNKRKIIALLLILGLLLADAAAQGFRRSRGGGPTRRTDWSSSHKSSPSFPKSSPTRRYTTGSKSSPVNVHLKHARRAASEDRPTSRSEAERSSRRPAPVQPAPRPRNNSDNVRDVNYFEEPPRERPNHVPPVVRREREEYPVVFHDHRYGYWQKGPQGLLFVPLILGTTQPGQAAPGPQPAMAGDPPGVPAPNASDDDTVIGQPTADNRPTPPGVRRYERRPPTEDGLPGWFDFISVLLFFGVMIGAILLVLRATQKRNRPATPAYPQKQERPADEQAQPPVPGTPLVVDSLWDKLYHARRNQMIAMSDPMTLAHFGRATDFQVDETALYEHSTFTLLRIDLVHAGGGEEDLRLALFLKEVEGDRCLFLGMLDHEGRDEELRASSWFHLDASGDRFADAFRSIFTLEGGESDCAVDFVQHDFGAFYDVAAGSKRKSVGICEYFPQEPPAGFDWQHAIVVWQGNWLRCYYCREIHERNIDIF